MTSQVHQDPHEGHRHPQLCRQDGQDAAAQRADAAEEVLQPPVPVWRGRARAALHHWPPPGRQQWQDDGAGQAAAQDEGTGWVLEHVQMREQGGY